MIDYGKVTTRDKVIVDGTLLDKITTESKHDNKTVAVKVEYELSIFATKESFLKDVIEAMEIISKGETKKVILEVKVDKDGQKVRLLKRWSVA